jgi:TolA-binding protein
MSKIKKADLIKTPKVEGQEEIQSNPIENFVKTEQYVRRNKIIIGMLAGVIIAVVVGYFIYNYLQTSQETKAQEQMFAAVRYLELGENKKAINGDGMYVGFESIIKNYPLSKAANLAYFYSGLAHLKEKKFNEAIERLRKFSGNDWLVQARSYCLMGDAYSELNKFNEAATYYEKAANYNPNKHFTPIYLKKLGLAYEKINKNQEALKVYAQIIKEYPNTSEYFDAKKYQARLETLLEK